MAANWWHIAETPNGRHVHQLDTAAIDAYVVAEMAADPALDYDTAQAEAVGLLAQELRDELGFPKGGRWAGRQLHPDDPEDNRCWWSLVSQGEPHESTLAAAAAVHRNHRSARMGVT
jgi:hypothetical protein